MTVTVYSTPQCPWCQKTKDLLKKKKVKFIEHNVAKSRKYAAEMIRLSGQSGVPVIHINDHVIIGFNEKDILAKLKK